MRHRPLLFFFFFVSLVCIIQYLRGSLDLPPCPFEDRETVILEGTIHNLELTQDGVRLILNRLGTVPGETEDPPVLFQKSTAILVYPDEQGQNFRSETGYVFREPRVLLRRRPIRGSLTESLSGVQGPVFSDSRRPGRRFWRKA